MIDTPYAVGVGVLIGCAVLAALFAVMLFRPFTHDNYGLTGFGISCAIGIPAALLLAVFMLGLNWPIGSTSYHRHETRSFLVASVDARILERTQEYAVTAPDGSVVKCEDTRCATLRTGDTVTLDCLRQWQMRGTPGYDCAFVSVKRGAGAAR